MKEMKIVVPGDKISDKPITMSNTYIKDDCTYAAVVGMCDENGRYTPLENVYIPKFDDTIVGIVIEKHSWGYSIDANLPSRAGMSSRDTRLRLRSGDVIVGKVRDFRMGEVSINDAKKLNLGKVFKVPASKVPRIIGKKSSMLNTIRDNSKTDVVAGNNGFIWVSSDGNVPLVKRALDMIIENAHTRGLTDKVTEFLKNQTKGE